MIFLTLKVIKKNLIMNSILYRILLLNELKNVNFRRKPKVLETFPRKHFRDVKILEFCFLHSTLK